MSDTTTTRPPSGDFASRAGFWLKFLGLGGAVLVALGTSVGVGQSPAQKPNDDVLQLRVQSALDNDPELKPRKLTVLVNVVDGAAVVGGPVPDADVISRIEAVAKAVPGITSVKLSAWVPSSLTPADPLSRKVAELMKPAEQPAKPTAEPPLLSLPPVARTVEPPPAKLTPVPTPVSPSTDPRPRGNSTSNKGPGGLLDPVGPGGSVQPSGQPSGTGFRPAPLAPGAAPLPYETIPPPGVPALPPQPEGKPDVKADPQPDFTPVDPLPAAKPASALEELRRDPRFAGLKVEITDGVAVITGRATGGSERVWSLAQAVRKLPNVERVVVRGQ